VDVKALELVARRIAATGGDARRVLEITSNAIGRCIDGLSKEDLEKEARAAKMPIVKITHMMGAIRDGNAVKHSELIRRQPPMAKIVLCIAVAMVHAGGPNTNISISLLRKFCVASTRHAMFEDTDLSSIMTMVQNLVDADLLCIDNNNGAFDIHDPDAKLQIGVQLDDVECALEESLLNGENGSFYSKVMDFIRTHGSRC
jgi:cell division control protein 6